MEEIRQIEEIYVELYHLLQEAEEIYDIDLDLNELLDD